MSTAGPVPCGTGWAGRAGARTVTAVFLRQFRFADGTTGVWRLRWRALMAAPAYRHAPHAPAAAFTTVPFACSHCWHILTAYTCWHAAAADSPQLRDPCERISMRTLRCILLTCHLLLPVAFFAIVPLYLRFAAFYRRLVGDLSSFRERTLAVGRFRDRLAWTWRRLTYRRFGALSLLPAAPFAGAGASGRASCVYDFYCVCRRQYLVVVSPLTCRSPGRLWRYFPSQVRA